MAPPWRHLHTAALGVGVEPVGTQPAVSAPAGGEVVDTEARAALAEVLRVLEAFGLTAAPRPVGSGGGRRARHARKDGA
ncbi:hypothetical protein [Pseudonocardia asaccharolytica]|nr:hypothetical protein [Pseudonocardia asaccharolytica]